MSRLSGESSTISTSGRLTASSLCGAASVPIRRARIVSAIPPLLARAHAQLAERLEQLIVAAGFRRRDQGGEPLFVSAGARGHLVRVHGELAEAFAVEGVGHLAEDLFARVIHHTPQSLASNALRLVSHEIYLSR
jgi:hypothetical protein